MSDRGLHCLPLNRQFLGSSNRNKMHLFKFKDKSSKGLLMCPNINPFIPSGLFYMYHNSLDRSIAKIRGAWLVLIIIMLGRNF